MALNAQRRGEHGAHDHRVLTLDADSDHPRALVGGKGRALGEIARLGLPVPPAFCLTIAWCRECAVDPHAVLDEAWPDVLDGLKALQERTGATFGGGERPLLVAVRSSGVTSMPGMLETVLDVGIDDAVADALAARYSPGFARDTLDRFRRGYRRAVHVDPPTDPYEQLRGGCPLPATRRGRRAWCGPAIRGSRSPWHRTPRRRLGRSATTRRTVRAIRSRGCA